MSYKGEELHRCRHSETKHVNEAQYSARYWKFPSPDLIIIAVIQSLEMLI